MARQLSTRGMRWALLCGILCALALPVRVECGYPGATACQRRAALGATCRLVEVEPWAIYTIERLTRDDVGVAYHRGEECD